MKDHHKFRVWNGDKFIEPIEIGQFPEPNEYGFSGDLVFQQYTGREDMNKVPVYEGDICKPYGEVVYDNTWCGFGFKNESWGRKWIPLNDPCWNQLVVVGNVFEGTKKN